MSPELILTTCASFFAGLVDSMVGGGGLILLPALFAAFPGAEPVTLFGTNKSASIAGTAMATWNYTRRVQLEARWLLVVALAALVGGFSGAWSVTMLDPQFLRRLLPFLLVAVLAYLLLNRQLGLTHAPRHAPRAQLMIGAAIGVVVGWYDGFFGPGTGSVLIFLFVRVLGFDFLHASAAAKVVNLTTNFAALSLFAAKGRVWWPVGLTLAVANVAGSLLGTRLALRHGAPLVRRAFLLVVCALILKTGYDALR